MHLFIYDSFLNQKRYQKTALKLESAISSLRLEGRSVKLSFLKDVREVVPQSLKKGYSTFICIGDDQTFSKVLNALPTFENVTMGVIPIPGENGNLIASALGIRDADSALNCVQKRIVTKIDVARANSHYFLSQLALEEENAEILCEEKFTFKPLEPSCRICLYNLTNGYPRDGFLEIGIENVPKLGILERVRLKIFSSKETLPQTRIPVKKARVIVAKKDSFSSVADQKIVLKNPALVEIIPEALRVITGDRLFEHAEKI